MTGKWYIVKATAQNSHMFTNPDTVTFDFFLDLGDSFQVQTCSEYAGNLLHTTDDVELVFKEMENEQ